jgi:hypothetical protein
VKNVRPTVQSLTEISASRSMLHKCRRDDRSTRDAAPAIRARRWVTARAASWMASIGPSPSTSPSWRPSPAIILGLLLLPPRGAAWEQRGPADSRWQYSARSIARFLRRPEDAAPGDALERGMRQAERAHVPSRLSAVNTSPITTPLTMFGRSLRYSSGSTPSIPRRRSRTGATHTIRRIVRFATAYRSVRSPVA